MKKAKRTPQDALPSSAAERPRAGGSYIRDRASGALERVEMTASAPIGADVPVEEPAPIDPGTSDGAVDLTNSQEA